MHGHSIIEGQPTSAGGDTFTATNPATGDALPTTFVYATADDVDRACMSAADVFAAFQRAERAPFLRAIADKIEALGDELLERFTAETALPRGRAEGECARTCGQLRNFADQIERDDWNSPIKQGNLSRRYVGIGPVAVFGPANFPLAYGVAGGDTASALAAGCPVIVKTHPSHPGVCELVAGAIVDAAAETGMPAGVFALLVGGVEVGERIVKHADVRGVGFTGSENGGRAIFDAAAARPTPIPAFAEMSSLNPIVVLPGHYTDEFVDGLVGSVTLGVGQFCTKPGLIFVPSGTDLSGLKDKLAAVGSQTMLNASMRKSYVEGTAKLASVPGTEALLMPEDDAGSGGANATPALLRVAATHFGQSKVLHREVFGPGTLVVEYDDLADVRIASAHLGGQLTASVHGEPDDDLLHLLTTLAGRVIFGGYPTGVEVTAAMVHGGPYPATTDARFTAVGDRAIDRWLRPVCLQGA
ncbi:MAG: aldehyde dehydrogenase (NADP(+)) [Planctomycetota bacterium]